MGDIDVEAQDDALNAEFYRPFDQDRWLPPPPWKPALPALVNWEAAHGHDVRMKCYVEYGCQAIQYEADALADEVARLRSVVAGVEALADRLEAEAAMDDIELSDAQQAVTAHYRESTEWLMAAHVRAAMRRIRAARVAGQVESVPDVDPDDVVAYQRALRAQRQASASGSAARRALVEARKETVQ